MKKLTLTLITVAMGLLLTMPVFAFGPGAGRGPGEGMGPGSGPGYHRTNAWEKLNLSAEQKTKIEALQTAHQKELRPVREKMFDKSVELRRLWLQTNPDKDKITAAQAEVSALRDQMQSKATAMRLEIRKVLTPEQQEKLVNSGWERGMGFGPRGGMRGHGGRGPGICY
ncbi:MAG: hypothetical protein CVU54_09130 [Deltaproteobacteria bacterium HGW-Deltaproteobacteria-12]|jgi:Spy/CpxP family protein refolding chaperone|nr:MAG: hypothetical protein CVU54_09130 [Deltaproteobacteria bacterium HGW-Deltaproteobacteria-12]